MAVLQTLTSDLGDYAAAGALLQCLRSPGVHLPRRVAVARAMQQAEVIPEHTVGGSTSSAHPTDGGSTSVQAPGPALAATAVPAPPPPGAVRCCTRGLAGGRVRCDRTHRFICQPVMRLPVGRPFGAWHVGVRASPCRRSLKPRRELAGQFSHDHQPCGSDQRASGRTPPGRMGQCAGRNCLNARHVYGTGISAWHTPSCGPAAHSAAACCFC